MLIIPPMIGPEYAPISAVAAFDEGNKRMHLAIPPAADREFADVASDQIVRFRLEQIERGRVNISDHTMPVDRHDAFDNVIDTQSESGFRLRSIPPFET